MLTADTHFQCQRAKTAFFAPKQGNSFTIRRDTLTLPVHATKTITTHRPNKLFSITRRHIEQSCAVAPLKPRASVSSPCAPHASVPCNITIQCWEGSRFQDATAFAPRTQALRNVIRAKLHFIKQRNPMFSNYVLLIVAYICRL